MATKTVADAKLSNLQAKLGVSTTNHTDLEFSYYSANSGLNPAAKYSLADHKRAFYVLKGATGPTLNDLEISYFKDRGAVGNSRGALELDFYTNRTFL